MNCRRFSRILAFLPLFSLALAWRANAQQDVAFTDPPQSSPQTPGTNVLTLPVEEKVLINFVEAGGSYRQLTNGFGDWSGGYATGVLAIGKNIWNAEVNGQHEFSDAGVYLAAGDTYNFNSDWYASLTLGSSVGGFFWPRFRADAFVNHKVGARKQFITTLGYGYYASKDVHRDQSVFIGTTYYFRGPWIVEDGVRFNVSNPGVVFSPAGFVAVTEGRNSHHYVTVNAGFGKEAYQLVGPTTVLARFPSQNLTVTWRQWVGKKWGFNLIADYYHSSFYERGGGSFDRPASFGSAHHRPAFTDRGRFRGCRGGVITMHRALTRLVLTPRDLVRAALLMLVLSFAWIVSLPPLCWMWGFLLGNGMRILALHTTLGLTEHHITRYIRFVIPYPRMEGIAPSAWTWWSTAAVVCLLFAASYFFPKKLTPVTYLVRAALFVQSTALLYFLLAAARFPHTPDSYMEGLISYQIALISAVPALFGLTYYIFKFSLTRKIALTVLTMSHLFLFLPVQILLQAAVLEKSVLFMPILYIVFGLPVNILIILAFYSWGMSWPSDGNVKKPTTAYRAGSPQPSGLATSRFA